MKRIIFNLKKEWYDLIEGGEKDIEYRRICKHWARRLGLAWPIGDADDYMISHGVILAFGLYAVFRLGYSRKYPDIVRRITMIDIGPCPYEGWDGKWFRIHFAKENAE